MNVLGVASALLLGMGVIAQAAAHSGGLDRHGCHTNRKTGEYHCHRAPATTTTAPQQLAPQPNPQPQEAPGNRPFRNCAVARAHGAAPVRRGDPGYGPHLDRDNDGVGCEPYRRR